MIYAACIEAFRGTLAAANPRLSSGAVDWLVGEAQSSGIPASFEQFKQHLLKRVPELHGRSSCKQPNLPLLCLLVKHAQFVRDKIPTTDPARAVRRLRQLFKTFPGKFKWVLAELQGKDMSSCLKLVHFFNVVYKLSKERHVFARLSHEQLLLTITALPDTCDAEMKLGGGARSDVLARRMIIYFLLEYQPGPPRSVKAAERQREFKPFMAAARKLPKPRDVYKRLREKYGSDWFDNTVDDSGAVAAASPLGAPFSPPQSPIVSLEYRAQYGSPYASTASPLTPTDSSSECWSSSPFSGPLQPSVALPPPCNLDQRFAYDGWRSPVSSSSSRSSSSYSYSYYNGNWFPNQQALAAAPHYNPGHRLLDCTSVSCRSIGSNTSASASYLAVRRLQIAESSQQFAAAVQSYRNHTNAGAYSPGTVSPGYNGSSSSFSPTPASPTPDSPAFIGVLQAAPYTVSHTVSHAVPHAASPPSATELPYRPRPLYTGVDSAECASLGNGSCVRGDEALWEDELLMEGLAVFI